MPYSEAGIISSTDAFPDLALSEVVRRTWIDHLVDLQVLAAHGDHGAAARVADWIAHDVEAREVCDVIAATCAAVRASTGSW